ncbi:MAG: glucosidase family protein [Saccharofermentanales bacterium]
MFKSTKAENLDDLHKKFEGTEIKYRFTADGGSYQIDCGESIPKFKLNRMAHDSKNFIVDSEDYFNRGVKRDDTIIVTGDRPGFALLRHQRQSRLDPEIYKYGDCRIKVTTDGISKWLDLADRIHTVFNPDSTEYDISLTPGDGLKIKFTVFQLENWGAGGEITVRNTTKKAIKADVHIEYGGVMSVIRTMSARYFDHAVRPVDGNKAEIKGKAAELTKDGYGQKATIITHPAMDPVIADSIVSYDFNLDIGPESENMLTILASLAESDNDMIPVLEDIADNSKYMNESKAYYAGLLKDIGMSTPNKLLDAGFIASVYNFDYIHTDESWIEGVHWWAAPWCNNYQMSAAISIGQLDRAREALLFFAAPEQGPCAATHNNGTPFIGGTMDTDDGIPYYLYELTQYYIHTQDKALVRELWDKVVKAVRKVLRDRDMKGEGLIGWHMGCNAFLYQADHLQLPGEGASPSIMIAGMLDRLSDIAKDLGENDIADEWGKLSGSMFTAIADRLWNKEAGAFYSHIDMENVKHMCHYYTDMVFPVLYSDMPDEYKWQSMEYLNKTLWTKNLFGDLTLMRVGDYKPSIFGSDNVMPVQMAEAARAYQKIGDFDRGLSLLESVALAGTIYTEAPGNFPERMSDDGKGEANYIFGNPIGSFLYTIVDGLFGIAVIDNGKTIRFEPAIPEEWEYADFQVPYAKISYKSEIKSANKVKTFNLINNDQEMLLFTTFLEPSRIVNVTNNGNSVKYRLEAALGKTRIVIETENKKSNLIRIEYARVEIRHTGEKLFERTADVYFNLNQNIRNVSDPCNMMAEMKIKGNVITGKLADKENDAILYVELSDINVIYPIKFAVRNNYSVNVTDLTYNPSEMSMQIKIDVDAVKPGDQLIISTGILGMRSDAALTFNKDKIATAGVVLSGIENLPEGVYSVEYEIKSKNTVVLSGEQRCDVKGSDSIAQTQMTKIRDSRLHNMDLTPYFNSNVIYAMTRWRADVPMIYYVDRLPEGKVETAYGTFRLNNKGGDYMCLLRKGSTNRVTGQPIDFDGITKTSISIDKKLYNIALFFAGEVESRQTFGDIGSIKLVYEDGDITEIPVIVGKNMGTLYSHFATDTIEVKEPGEVWKGNSWDIDSMNVYRIPCDPSRRLKELSIQMDLYDVNFGLMGMNTISAD